MYSAQGAASEYTEDFFGQEIKYETKTKLDYLNLPIMAKYYVAEGLSIEAGPQVGFLISAKSEVEATSEGESASDEGDVKDSFKSIDFGAGVGLGYKLESGLNFSARYNLGLANIAEDVEGQDFSIQNNVIQVSVGFMF
ncbi:porin family protein [Lacinutrix neustonica]|uniref:Porin family protein n=1 Tax=Lacinutrix neustonica TaxID=2980107 RepID=A0A9E8N0Z9_9FLAO|nr:porin family protein [Lacinutrix neustonica]WAC03840.1 porin family protein [Lacinutrix neustonica]